MHKNEEKMSKSRVSIGYYHYIIDTEPNTINNPGFRVYSSSNSIDVWLALAGNTPAMICGHKNDFVSLSWSSVYMNIFYNIHNLPSAASLKNCIFTWFCFRCIQIQKHFLCRRREEKPMHVGHTDCYSSGPLFVVL